MDVVLKENVEKLGVKGETVYVKAGYGRNFLVPKGLAMPISSAEAKTLAVEFEKKKNQTEGVSKDTATNVALPDLEFKVKSKKDGTTYIAVNAAKIKKELEGKGIKVKKVELTEGIKKIGKESVGIILSGEKEAIKIKVNIVPL